MHSLGEGFLATTGFTIYQQRHVTLEHPHCTTKLMLQLWIEQADRPRFLPLGGRLRGWQRRLQRGAHLATHTGEQQATITGA
ncbi:hypothetical protein D3C76_1570220 [compost metagenome]